jgi:hypothetical protein
MGHHHPVHERSGITWRQANRAFIEHARSYVLVNVLLIVIWLVTTPGGYFWPFWPLLGWGIGLVAHAMATFNHTWAADERD